MVESRTPCRGDEIGKHSGLKKLSARPETAGAEPLKFGETPGLAPRQRRAKPDELSTALQAEPQEGVETRRGAPNAFDATVKA